HPRPWNRRRPRRASRPGPWRSSAWGAAIAGARGAPTAAPAAARIAAAVAAAAAGAGRTGNRTASGDAPAAAQGRTVSGPPPRPKISRRRRRGRPAGERIGGAWRAYRLAGAADESKTRDGSARAKHHRHLPAVAAISSL